MNSSNYLRVHIITQLPLKMTSEDLAMYQILEYILHEYINQYPVHKITKKKFKSWYKCAKISNKHKILGTAYAKCKNIHKYNQVIQFMQQHINELHFLETCM